MADSPLQSTMRELQRLATAPRFWAAIAAAALLLGLVGPFGTYEGLRLPARLAYWAAIAAATYFVGVAVVHLQSALWERRRGKPGPAVYALFGAIAGVPVTLGVWALNTAVFEDGAIPLLPLLGYVVAISAVLSAVLALFIEQFERQQAAAAPPPAVPSIADTPSAQRRPRILDRLPPHLRGELSHMTMQDHYVDIRTDKGGALVLMRLADAIAETDGVEGLQIHRSHWVALGQVAQTVRLGGRPMLKMKAGAMLPVSRSYLDAVRAAGFF